jgi:hypothetical protein
MERWELEQRLAEVVMRDVDLVDLRAASTVMRAQIIHTGDVLFSADDDARELFECTAYSAYALLNEERAGIPRDIAEPGDHPFPMTLY